MEELPKTITQEMWVGLWLPGGTPELMRADMSAYGCAMLGQVEVTVDVPQVNPTEKLIESLKAERTRKEAEHYRDVKRINEKIRSLEAIEYKPEGSA